MGSVGQDKNNEAHNVSDISSQCILVFLPKSNKGSDILPSAVALRIYPIKIMDDINDAGYFLYPLSF